MDADKQRAADELLLSDLRAKAARRTRAQRAEYAAAIAEAEAEASARVAKHIREIFERRDSRERVVPADPAGAKRAREAGGVEHRERRLVKARRRL